ncbi:polysaccharide biosynthesis/export family protein [Sphingomonas bacterium]|uniref:polysaccharide biosynthesis/export family protein n=1 Tax=Sphingomonas bacterium TaxID=1895847 RepID=UPI0015762B38|nr:polysaccharide biosynthesis/export family protein [Sphingomonas bacterium]
MMTRTFRSAAIARLIAMLLGLCLAAAASAQAAGGDYLVGPGDVLKVSVYRQADLDTVAMVAPDGTVQIGSVGGVKVDGLTASDVGRKIADRLKSAGILLNPTVNVLVTEYHSRTISVLGAVARPGELPIDRPNLSITEALARAGANFERGGALITIVPPTGSKQASETMHVADLVSGGRNRPLRPGESIFVQAAAMVFVRGEVQRPGSYPIDPGMTVDQAIAVAGGLTPRGSAGHVRVTHQEAAGAPAAAVRARLRDPVQPNDTLVVGSRLF